ncbi:MAG: hypothetical protein GY768_05465 [Planctomycetaceae bacterium]|nr:hypothetical protein [Planctomycetaceae bacterium]
MQTIDEPRLETDAQYRFDYLAEFIGFTSDDASAIQASAPHIGPRIGELVDKTYERLLSYDATARHFVPKQHGCDSEAPIDLASLDKDHPQIQFRKDHLNRYFMQLISRSYDAKMIQYVDMVGKMHTTAAGSKEIEIPLVQMNALMGVLSDVVLEAILESPVDNEGKAKTLKAFNKLLWIQNDFISRHY